MEIIGQGAEAILYKKENKVIKDRISKSYRLIEIDNKLRKFRTRREAKVLQKLSEINFPCPLLINMNDKSMKIDMSFITGQKVRDVLSENPVKLSKEIGRKVGILHSKEIIHADLTTSNMILDNEIYFIDFGLSFFSNKVEDKAVDLHLLNRALESRHHDIYSECWSAVISGYKEYSESESVLNRLEQVELRGRHKKKS